MAPLSFAAEATETYLSTSMLLFMMKLMLVGRSWIHMKENSSQRHPPLILFFLRESAVSLSPLAPSYDSRGRINPLDRRKLLSRHPKRKTLVEQRYVHRRDEKEETGEKKRVAW
jgi:hypothetical protein